MRQVAEAGVLVKMSGLYTFPRLRRMQVPYSWCRVNTLPCTMLSMNNEIDEPPRATDAQKAELIFYPRSSLLDVARGLEAEEFAPFDARIVNGSRSMAWTEHRQELVQEDFPDSYTLIHPAREKKKLFRRESDGEDDPVWTHVDAIRDMVERHDPNGHNHLDEGSLKTDLEALHLQDQKLVYDEGQLEIQLAGQRNNHGSYGASYLSPHEILWTYLDSSGNLQGPFSGIQMHEWYEAGYFPPSLSIRRESGGDFAALTSWIASLGPKPFLISTTSDATLPAHPTPFEASQPDRDVQQREPQAPDIASFVEAQADDIQKEMDEETLAQSFEQAVAEEDPPEEIINVTPNADLHESSTTVQDVLPDPLASASPITAPLAPWAERKAEVINVIPNADLHHSNLTVRDFLPDPSFPVASASPPTAPSAPWAERRAAGSTNAPSLRDILTAEEARNALAQKRQILQAAQAAAVVDPMPVKAKEKPLVVPSAEGKAWSTSTSQSPKSMSQIQQEERDAALRLQQQQLQAARQKNSLGKSFADLAKQPNQPSPAATGWTTVGEKGKPVSKPIPPPAPIVRSPAPKPQPAPARPASTPAKPNGEGFLTWCAANLKGLNADVIPSEFITMISSFPVLDNPSETVEIVSDMVYAASRTIDGRRFAEEFVRRRREMEKGGWSAVVKKGAMPEKKKDEWHGAFKVVERKKAKKQPS